MEDDFQSDRLRRRWRMLGLVLAIGVYAYLVVPSLIVIPISFGGVGEEMKFPPETISLHLYKELFTTATWMQPVLQSP